jgi:ABC-type uncharacterized transport system auxiliary subunit
VFASGCTTQVIKPNTYYVLEYFEDTEEREMVREEPFDASVHIVDTDIPRTYSRNQIVQRGVGPQMQYMSDHLWGGELSSAIADLLGERALRYNLFRNVRRDFARETADYRIESDLDRIEFAVFEENYQAVVEIELHLVEENTGSVPVRYKGVRREAVYEENVGRFVEIANEILFEEMDIFLQQVIDYLSEGTESRVISQDEGEAETETTNAETDEGIGFLMVPALNDYDNQPYYSVYDQKGDFVSNSRIGTAVELPTGQYTVEFGSGGETQQMRKTDITVTAQRRTVLRPDWSSLIVRIIDANRDPVKLRYDIYDARTGENYGGKISVDETVGELPQIWVLKPEHYKITINNQPFNALRDFVTVLLEDGKTEQLTIVVETDEEVGTSRLIGAGVIDAAELADEENPLSFTSAVNGNFSFNANNETSAENYSVSMNLDSELDTNLIFDLYPLYYRFQNITGFGFTSTNNKGLRITDDLFQIRNTLIYYFIQKVGIYGRLDGTTNFTGKKVYPSTPQNYIKRDINGVTVEQEEGVEEISLSPPFFPIELREGLGLNYRAIQTTWLDFNIRAGLGADQTLNYQVYTYAGVETIGAAEYTVYEQAETTADFGMQFSALASLRLPFDIVVTSNVDLLVPFDASPVDFEWENIFNINIFRYLSIYYRLFMTNKGLGADTDYLVNDHSIFIRFTYVFK